MKPLNPSERRYLSKIIKGLLNEYYETEVSRTYCDKRAYGYRIKYVPIGYRKLEQSLALVILLRLVNILRNQPLVAVEWSTSTSFGRYIPYTYPCLIVRIYNKRMKA